MADAEEETPEEAENETEQTAVNRTGSTMGSDFEPDFAEEEDPSRTTAAEADALVGGEEEETVNTTAVEEEEKAEPPTEEEEKTEVTAEEEEKAEAVGEEEEKVEAVGEEEEKVEATGEEEEAAVVAQAEEEEATEIEEALPTQSDVQTSLSDDEGANSPERPTAGEVTPSPLITEVSRAVQPPRSPKKSVRRSGRLSRYFGTSYSSEELRRLFDRMMKSKRPPELAALLPLHGWVGREMAIAVEDRAYDYGSRLKMGDAMIMEFMNADQSAFIRERRRKEAEEHCGQVTEYMREKDGEWMNALRDAREKHEGRSAALNAAHKAEIKEFEGQWADPDYLVAFKKPSPKLIVLRTREKALALQKEFEQAKKIRQEADRLEREEVVEAERRAIAAMKIEYSNMEARHERELTGLRGLEVEWRERLQKRRNECIGPLQLLIARLMRQAHPPVVPERKKEGIFLPPPWPESPRTVRHVREARTLQVGKPIGLSGIRMRQYIKIKKDDPKKRASVRKKRPRPSDL
jgi:hypothetical protein